MSLYPLLHRRFLSFSCLKGLGRARSEGDPRRRRQKSFPRFIMWGQPSLHAGGEIDCDVLVFTDDKTASGCGDRAGGKPPECAASTAEFWRRTPFVRGPDVGSDGINRRYKQ